MKKIYFIFLLGSVEYLSSCQKNISDFDPSQQPAITKMLNGIDGGISAAINGKQLNFIVTSSALTRYPLTNEKRLDIAATSTDNTQKISITLGEQTSQGNEIAAKKYTRTAFPVDDPTTPNIDESAHSEGYSSYGTLSNTGWVFDSYDEAGSCTISSCDESNRLISGVFQTTLVLHTDKTQIIKITSGNIINVKYRVMN